MTDRSNDRIRVANSRMKAPGDERNTWGHGIIQIMITRACDLACINCTQGSNLAGKPMIMSLPQFEEAVRSLKDYYGIVGIFGGNPCMHPKFADICNVLAEHIPYHRRGLWSNNLNGHGKLCRATFNPEVSNLNVHTSFEAYSEMLRDWPECHPKGVHDSRHSPVFVAMKDLDIPFSEMWELIQNCDINQLWSAMIGVFRGELRAWFCEVAGAQSMLHENEPSYPDTGLKVTEHWWKLPIASFTNQVMKHCFECSVPLKGMGDLAINGHVEQVSKTHEKIFHLKRANTRLIQVITRRDELGGEVEHATNYIENGILFPMENK